LTIRLKAFIVGYTHKGFTVNNHELVSQILNTAGSQFVSVVFEKINGEKRQLTFNPKHIGEIKGTGSKCQDPNIFRIMDINLKQWRSFDARRVISIKVSGQLTELNKKVL